MILRNVHQYGKQIFKFNLFASNIIKTRRTLTTTFIYHNKLQQNNFLKKLFKHEQLEPISEDFKTIYQFPSAKYCSILNRLKIYQTIGTILATTGVLFLSGVGLISTEWILPIIGLGISGCAFFYSIGYAAAGFVGFIYYNKTAQIFRIAYVDFWGKRRDILAHLNEIAPLSSDESQGISKKLYYQLRVFSINRSLKLPLNKQYILDYESFNELM